MKKRVLIFSLTYFPFATGGAESAIEEITKRIDPNEVEFHMVTLRLDSRFPRVEQVGNVLVHRIGFSKEKPTLKEAKQLPLFLNKPLFQFLAAWKACWLHRTYRYDAIWAMMAHSTGVPAALFKMTHPAVPYVLTLQEGDPPEYVERTLRPLWPLFTRAFTKADVVQAISSFLGDWARRRGFRGPLEIIRNGANPQDVDGSVSSEALEAARQVIKKQTGEIVLMNTARLVPQKGADVTIRALKLLPEHVRLVLVGDGPEMEHLKALTHSLDLTGRVQFTGAVDRSVVTAYRQVADIFVAPSRSEGLGMAFLSAMASRLPVVATQVGGLSEFVFDAKRNPDKPTTAWAVDPDQPEQIAAAVQDILAHPDVVKQVAERARELVLKEYNWEMIAKEMRERIFERLWNKREDRT